LPQKHPEIILGGVHPSAGSQPSRTEKNGDQQNADYERWDGDTDLGYSEEDQPLGRR